MLEQAEAEASNPETSAERLQQLARRNTDLARIVAQNPSAPASLLEKLSRSRKPLTRQAVAGNPNASPKVLFKLLEEFPEQLLDNPVLPLLQLEDPNFLDKIPSKTLYKFFESPRARSEFLLMGCNSISNNVRYCSRYFLEKNDCKPQFLEQLIGSAYEEIRVTVATHRNASSRILEKLARDESQAVRSRVAENPQTPDFILAQLANDPSDRDNYIRWLSDPGWNAPTGGEKGIDIARRSALVLEEIEQKYQSGNVLIVSHKATIRIMLCELLGIDVGRFRDRIGMLVASISIVEIGARGPLLKVLGDRSHLRASLRDRAGS